MERKSKLRLTTSRKDWQFIRECYIKSFLRYPLYTYMEPDQSKRREFLRIYLDANFDVTVGSGKGVILALETVNGCAEKDTEPESDKQLIGGILFVLPSKTGCIIQDDEVYWKAYEEHGLGEVSPTGMERVKRYEAWEYDYVTKSILDTSVPVFNGLFCAIQPEFTSQGLASSKIKEGLRMLYTFLSEQKRELCAPESPIEQSPSQHIYHESENCLISEYRNNLNLTNALSRVTLRKKNLSKLTSYDDENQWPKMLKKSTSSTSYRHKVEEGAALPLMIGICHNILSAHFYELVGFKKVFQTHYKDAGASFPVSVFTMNILLNKNIATSRL